MNYRGICQGASCLLLLALLGACPRRDATPASRADAGRKTDPDDRLVVARVGEDVITLGQFKDELSRLPPAIRMRFASEERRKEFLKNLVRFEVLAREARRRKLDQDPEVVRRVKRSMIDAMMDQLRSTLVRLEDITDEQVAEYYRKHKDLYQQPPQVRASIIVTPTREAALKVVGLVQKKPDDLQHFAELVKEHSVDPSSKVRRGDLGFFSREEQKIAREIVEAAFAVPRLWTVAEPFKSGEGWVVLVKTGETAEVNRPLEFERVRIKNRLFNERRLEAVERFIADLQARAKVEVNEANLAKVRPEEMPQPGPSSTIPPEIPGAGTGAMP